MADKFKVGDVIQESTLPAGVIVKILNADKTDYKVDVLKAGMRNTQNGHHSYVKGKKTFFYKPWTDKTFIKVFINYNDYWAKLNEA